MFAKPVLQPETEELDKCLLCNKTIHNYKLQPSVGASGLKTTEEKAKAWEKINVREDDDKYREFTESLLKLLRDLLVCRVNTVTSMFVVAVVFHSELSVTRNWNNMEW